VASKIVSLILQAKNKLSPTVDKATASLNKMREKSGQLERELSKFNGAKAAVDSLNDVKESTASAEKAFDAAQLEVIRLKTALKFDKSPEIALALDKAKIAASGAKKEWASSEKTVKSLEKTLDRAGVEIKDAARAEEYLAKEIDRTTKELTEHNAKLDKASAKYKKAGDSAKTSGKGVKSFIASAAGLIGVTLLLGKIRDGFSSLATAVFKTGDEFELLSKRLNSDELKFIEEFARDTPLQLSGVADAFIRLRAFGVDPTLGAMQALTDQNAALGGGQAELEGIINAVGQAWAKQKLQGEEILQLVERGVPAWDLLAKATGKNTRELSKMSEQGKLGRKEIRLLIEEIAKANEGEAAKAMSTLSGIVSNLNDDFTMFYRKVADYGALDKLKEAFVGVREQIAGMADDGRLDKLAEATSNYFSTVIQWSKESASSLNTNFGAIYGSAKIVSNSIAIVFDGLKASVAGAGVVIASVLELMSSFGGFDEFSKKAGIAADAFKTQFEKAGDSIRENFGDIKNGAELLPQSFDQITTSINKTAAANKEQGDAANAAGEASKKAGEDSKKASDEAAEAARRQAEAQVEALDALGRLGIEQAQLTNEVTTGVAQSIQDLQSLDSQLSEIGKGANNSSIFFDAIKKSISGIKTEADELALSKSIDEFRQKGQITYEQYSQLKDKVKEVGSAAVGAGDQMSSGIDQAGKSAEQASQKVDLLADAAEKSDRDVRGAASSLAAFFNGVKSEVYALSDAAGAAFSNKMGIDVQPVLDEIESLKAGIDSAHVEISALGRDNLTLFDATGIARFSGAVLNAQNEVEIAYNSQKIKFLEYLDVIKSGEGINESFLNSAESSINNMSLLGQEDLSQLRNALDSANQKLQQMNDNAQNTLEGLQNELDSLQGNQDAIEQRDYNRKREELNAAIEDAKLYGNKEAIASYTEALQVLDQVRRERSNQSRESERAAKNSSRSTSNRSSQSNSSSTTINLRSPEGNKSVTLNGDQKAVDGLLDLLNDYGMRSQ
jgi:tape measure domain-containing protein